ncbi:hypothetical protein QZH41_007782 [Actinostola sp. cb2023]|nr:hypothetical protein QZH41_007782 [Actinostola sp. cb2023]
MAALIASRLAQTIYTEFKIKPATVTLWSDSTIVLHWLWSETATLKPFVGVRVAEIQSTWAPSCWKHVPTEQNVADDLSRGISVRELSEGRWLNGPSFLKKPKTEWPSENISVVNEDSEKKSVASATPVTKSVPLVEPSEYSSWGKLKRVIAYCLRFVNNLKSSLKDPAGIQKGPLQPEEMDASEDYWIRESQRDLKIADIKLVAVYPGWHHKSRKQTQQISAPLRSSESSSSPSQLPYLHPYHEAHAPESKPRRPRKNSLRI